MDLIVQHMRALTFWNAF